jgi:hypothetical protein
MIQDLNRRSKTVASREADKGRVPSDCCAKIDICENYEKRSARSRIRQLFGSTTNKVRRVGYCYLADESELRDVERIELVDEVVGVSIAISHSLECSDLIVDAFEWSAGDWEIVPIENSRTKRG